MMVSVSKSEIKGMINAPPSKSYTIRGLMCAALADGESKLIRPLSADDTRAACEVLSKVGVRIDKLPDQWIVKGDSFHQPDTDLFCEDSAATLRFMTAISSMIPGKCRLTARQSLGKRPIQTLIDALRQLGVNCTSTLGFPPVVVEGGTFKGSVTELPGDISSQFVSALLLVAPLAKEKVNMRLTTPLESKPYVNMTLECLEKFGIRVKVSPDMREFEISPQNYIPATYIVEADWSSASYLLALGATLGEIKITNLNLGSLQGDKVILDLLKQMGASITVNKDTIKIKKLKLHAIQADLSDCIDLLPTMAVLAAVAEGTSTFTGVGRARLKESNRIASLREGLERMEIPVKEEENELTIIGSTPKGAMIDSKYDHRIAMAFSILGVIAGNTVIDDAECVSKTFPEFWDILKNIGGKVSADE